MAGIPAGSYGAFGVVAPSGAGGKKYLYQFGRAVQPAAASGVSDRTVSRSNCAFGRGGPPQQVHLAGLQEECPAQGRWVNHHFAQARPDACTA